MRFLVAFALSGRFLLILKTTNSVYLSPMLSYPSKNKNDWENGDQKIFIRTITFRFLMERSNPKQITIHSRIFFGEGLLLFLQISAESNIIPYLKVLLGRLNIEHRLLNKLTYAYL